MSKKVYDENVIDNMFPSFNIDDIDEEIEEVPKKKERRGRPKKKGIIRKSGAQQGLPVDEMRKTYIMQISTIEKLEAYADLTGQTIKDSLDELLLEALEDKI